MTIAKKYLLDRSGQRSRAGFLLCAAFALGVLLTFEVARAQQQAKDDPTFRKLIDDYCAAWSTGNTDNAGKFYVQDSDLIFYDVTHHSPTTAGKNTFLGYTKHCWITLRK